jgi:pimeloyl-ACP methyl ester carboxylesterase
MIPTTFKDQYISCKNKEQYLGDLLLIHGYCVEYSYFNAAKAVDELSKYFNVYLLDLPGHGTNKEGIVPEDMKLWRIADYIASYIEHKKLNNFYLMGHSMGGALVSLVTTKIPEKIKKLFLITPANPSA